MWRAKLCSSSPGSRDTQVSTKESVVSSVSSGKNAVCLTRESPRVESREMLFTDAAREPYFYDQESIEDNEHEKDV